MDITDLRKYRLKLGIPPFNNTGDGIALFDFSITFLVAYIVENYIRSYLNISRKAYYLTLLPLGVVVHVLTKQDTFLNRQLFDRSLNLYKIIVVFILYELYLQLNK
jgi:hypothetical protein